MEEMNVIWEREREAEKLDLMKKCSSQTTSYIQQNGHSGGQHFPLRYYVILAVNEDKQMLSSTVRTVITAAPVDNSC